MPTATELYEETAKLAKANIALLQTKVEGGTPLTGDEADAIDELSWALVAFQDLIAAGK